MTQSLPSADTLSKASSLISGLLSQMGGAAAAGSPGDMFASLLGNGQDTGLAAALDAQTQTSQNKSATFATASATSAATTMAQSDATADTTTGSGNSVAGLIQNLRNVARSLHKIMDGLQNKQAHTQTKNKTSTIADTQDANDASTTTGDTTNITTTATTQDSTDDSNDPAKQVAALIAELMSMTQLMMQMLHLAQTAGNAPSGATTGADSASSSGNALLSDLQAAGGAGLGSDLLTLAKDLQALGATNGTATGATQDTTDDSDGSTGNVLADLLQTIEKNALQIGQELEQIGKTGSATTTATTTLAATDDKMAAQFAALDKTLKQIVAGLEQEMTAPVTQTNTELAKTAQKNADSLNLALASMGTAGAPDPNAKSATSDAVQNRLYPLTATPAPSPHAQSAAQTQIQAQQTAQQTQAQNDATQQTSTATSASAIAMAAKDSATAGDDDTPSDHQPAFTASATAGLDSNGENVQATGYASFANTMSAFRAQTPVSTGMPSPVDQIIMQLNRSVKNGNDQLTLQLHPADMGKITVKLDMGSDGKVQGTVTADNPKTLDMLQKDSRSLERALQDAGLRADSGSLQFNLGHQQGQNQAGQTAEGQNGDSDGSDGTINANQDMQADDMSALQETYYVTPSGVNIKV